MRWVTLLAVALFAALAFTPARVARAATGPTTCEVGLGGYNFSETQRFCEKTITSGVAISNKLGTVGSCTAGPLLFQGHKTYLLTAGHCITTNGEKWYSWNLKNPAEQLEIGPAMQPVNGMAGGPGGCPAAGCPGDYGEIEVLSKPDKATNWAEPDAVDPIYAGMVEWKGLAEASKPVKSVQVEGKEASKIKQEECLEGFTEIGGEKCEELVRKLGQTVTYKAGKPEEVTVGGLVEAVSLREAKAGSSGAPWFLVKNPDGTSATKLLIEGTESGGPEGKAIDYYEPIGTILAAYPGQELLTKENENRDQGKCKKDKKVNQQYTGEFLDTSCTNEGPEDEGPYEWNSSENVNYTGKIATVSLQGPDGAVTCKKGTSSGAVNVSVDTDVSMFTFTACTFAGASCTSEGKASGTITWGTADTYLLYGSEAGPGGGAPNDGEAWNEMGLHGSESEPYEAKFDCGTLADFRISGTLACPMAPIGKMSAQGTITCKTGSGEQELKVESQSCVCSGCGLWDAAGAMTATFTDALKYTAAVEVKAFN